jgi:hypothetical protein
MATNIKTFPASLVANYGHVTKSCSMEFVEFVWAVGRSFLKGKTIRYKFLFSTFLSAHDTDVITGAVVWALQP